MTSETEEIVVWYCASAGVQRGPLLREDVISLIDSGALPSGALCWREGMSAWEPLAIHFDSLGNKSAAPPRRLAETPSRAGGVWWKVVALLGAIGGLVALPIVYGEVLLLEKPDLVWGVWVGLLSFAGLFSALSLWAWWPRNVNEKRAGIAAVLCSLGGVVAALTLIVFASQTSQLHRIAVARQGYSDYTVKVDVARNAIVVNGTIGPGMAERVAQLIDAHSGLRELSLTSPGGLVDEGLALAKLLEKNPNIVVVARGECNSACLLVIAGAKTRAADFDLEFGFHATSAITRLDAASAEAMAEQGEESDAYLVARGVPAAIVQQTKETGPEKLVPAAAIELKESGFLSRLMFDDAEIELPLAKWHVVERATSAETPAMGALLEAIRANAAQNVDRHADALYSSWHAQDAGAFAKSLAAITAPLKEAALAAADDAELVALVAASAETASDMIEREAWSECVTYFDEGGAGPDVPARLKEREMEKLTDLITSAGKSAWKARKVSAEGEVALAAFVRAVGEKAAADGGEASDILSETSRGKCLFYHALFEFISSAAPKQSAALYRHLAALGADGAKKLVPQRPTTAPAVTNVDDTPAPPSPNGGADDAAGAVEEPSAPAVPQQ